MDDVRTLIADLAGGRLSRRQFLSRAAALGLSAPLAAMLASNPAAALAQAQGAEPGSQPGPATSKLIFSAFNVDQAPLNIQHGDMDLYLFSLKSAGAQAIQSNPQGVHLIQSPATTVDLLLNPAPDPNGLNPFAITEVRDAMQYLVDRNFIANNIYQGRAVPMLSFVSPLDYDELTVFPVIHSTGIHYDPEYAKQQMTQALQKAGASLQNSVWSFKGQPIVIKFLIRVEDERRDAGDLVRAALQKLGFQVQPLYQPFGPATLAVYASDPVTFQWHIYTEGWSRSSSDRYDSTAINQYTAPWLGNMPGWQETGFWQYQQPELDKLGQQLFRGEFTSKAQRDDIYRQMTQLSLAESVRIWMVTGLNSFPIRDDVKDVTLDIVGGPNSYFTLPGADVPGRDQMKIGNLWVWTDQTTWNPVGGFGDAYSTDIYRNMVDAPILNHPFTGLPMPWRASYKVETAGPGKTMPVPADAVLWDATNDAWKPVGNGATATSKVTWDYSKYFTSEWHHGQPITPADLLYSLSQSFEIAYDPDKLQIETALGVTSRPYLETFKGFRLMPDNTFEVYVSYWHFEPSYIASYGSPAGFGTPWELLAAMDDLVFNQRRAAYSDTAAARFNVPWLSLVQENDARLVLGSLRTFGRQKAVPKGVFEINGKSLVTPEQAAARYKAAVDWFGKTQLLVISSGPYSLSRYDPPSQFAQLDAFRPKSYPFVPKDWRFGTPPQIAITPGTPPQASIGQPINVPLTVKGPGKLSIEYILVDPAANKVVASGNGAPGANGDFTVALDTKVTSNLFPSVYQLYVLASSDAISQVAEREVDLNIGA